jgi:heme/copper-type cytochrome/quinol oxidase subunit 2
MNFINENANIFFFVTTILVVILIIISVVLLFGVMKVYNFIRKAINKGDALLEDVKANEFVKKGAPIVLPIILPIISFFMKNKSKSKK